MTEARTPAIRELPFRHNQKPGLGFEIFTLQDLYDRAERHGYDLVSPQRPEFHTIYLGTRGRGTHVVDFTPAPLGAGFATVVARGRPAVPSGQESRCVLPADRARLRA